MIPFQEWQEINEILRLFCSATGLSINWNKSTFHFANLQQQTLEHLRGIFPYSFTHLSVGLTYLGYFLKVDSYKPSDWNWLACQSPQKDEPLVHSLALSWRALHSH
jgi:hypothetical protein